MIAPGESCGVTDAVPQLERVPEMAFRLGRCSSAQCLSSGRDRRRKRPGCVVGGRPVAGDLSQTFGTPNLQTRGEAPVNPRPLARHEVVVEHLTAEFVTEPHLVAVWHQQRGGEQLVERRPQCLGARPVDVGEYVGSGRARSRDDTEHLDGSVVERGRGGP